MGLLDNLLGQGGGLGNLASLVANNPQLLSAVASLLSARDTSVGGSGGLNGLVQALQGQGLGDVVSSWISTGENQPISPAQVTSALGPDTLTQFASKAGISAGDAGSVLAGLLPTVVNQLTPNGTLPETNAVESALGGLLSSLGAPQR